MTVGPSGAMSAGNSFGRVVTIPRLTIAFLLILAVYLFHDRIQVPTTYTPSTPSASGQQKESTQAQHDAISNTTGDISKTHGESCRNAPGSENVFIMLKTGATEIYEKLPTHFVTLFKCTPHFMIFSDLAQDFADYVIHDAIAPVSKHYREHHEDFELYRKLIQYQREGQDVSKLKGDGGWNLDKWKFLPMLFKAFETASPEVEWFVMMEADTSVSWTNLLQFLKTMNPDKPFYLGAQNVIGDTTFAHGGSGIIMSRQAAKQLRNFRNDMGKEKYDERWEELTSTSCCGDEIVARALLEVDIALTPAWPLIQGETVASLDWTENHWCTPAVTWHHVTPIEIDAMWQFQSDWVDDKGWSTPYLYRDVFAHFIDRHVTVNRTSWNNLSQDRKLVREDLSGPDDIKFYELEEWEREATGSENACAEACMRKKDECIQWMYSPGRCHLGRDMRFGKSDERESDHWTSGWVQERVQKFKEHFEGCKVRWAG